MKSICPTKTTHVFLIRLLDSLHQQNHPRRALTGSVASKGVLSPGRDEHKVVAVPLSASLRHVLRDERRAHRHCGALHHRVLSLSLDGLLRNVRADGTVLEQNATDDRLALHPPSPHLHVVRIGEVVEDVVSGEDEVVVVPSASRVRHLPHRGASIRVGHVARRDVVAVTVHLQHTVRQVVNRLLLHRTVHPLRHFLQEGLRSDRILSSVLLRHQVDVEAIRDEQIGVHANLPGPSLGEEALQNAEEPLHHVGSILEVDRVAVNARIGDEVGVVRYVDVGNAQETRIVAQQNLHHRFGIEREGLTDKGGIDCSGVQNHLSVVLHGRLQIVLNAVLEGRFHQVVHHEDEELHDSLQRGELSNQWGIELSASNTQSGGTRTRGDKTSEDRNLLQVGGLDGVGVPSLPPCRSSLDRHHRLGNVQLVLDKIALDLKHAVSIAEEGKILGNALIYLDSELRQVGGRYDLGHSDRSEGCYACTVLVRTEMIRAGVLGASAVIPQHSWEWENDCVPFCVFPVD